MNSFWEVRWGDVLGYGVLPTLAVVGVFLVWKLGRAIRSRQGRPASSRTTCSAGP
jgi:hypothetical protein